MLVTDNMAFMTTLTPRFGEVEVERSGTNMHWGWVSNSVELPGPVTRFS
jgi:hypothetical protein